MLQGALLRKAAEVLWKAIVLPILCRCRDLNFYEQFNTKDYQLGRRHVGLSIIPYELSPL